MSMCCTVTVFALTNILPMFHQCAVQFAQHSIYISCVYLLKFRVLEKNQKIFWPTAKSSCVVDGGGF